MYLDLKLIALSFLISFFGKWENRRRKLPGWLMRPRRKRKRRESVRREGRVEKPHKKLDVWQVGMDLVTAAYKATESFPKEERYGLTNQIRRAAVSVPSNIAEGAARNTKKEFVNYLHMAQGSLSELDTQLEVAKRLQLVNGENWEKLDAVIQRVDKMLTGLIRHQSVQKALPHA